MAVTIATVEAAITAILDGGQSATVDGMTYTQANIAQLITLRDQLKTEGTRTDGTRPTFRVVNISGMGY